MAVAFSRRAGWLTVALAVLAVLVAASTLPACSDPTDDQPFPGRCAPFEVVRYSPRDMSQGVPTNTPIDLFFSDYPDPDTVLPQALLLTTGVFWHPGTYSVDLLTRRVRFRSTSQLRPELGYSINVGPTMRSLQGCFTSAQHRSFRTGTGPAMAAVAPPPPPTFNDVLPILSRSCGGTGCHRGAVDDGGGCLAQPAMGLSLCDADALAALVSVPSRQVRRLQLVAPRDASRSYLLRKLLPAGDGDPALAPPAPTTLGHRDPPGQLLGAGELRTISDWIDRGAPP